jgi:hypothetical protein
MTRPRLRYATLGLIGAAVAALAIVGQVFPGVRLRAARLLQSADLIAPPLPPYVVPNAPADRVTARTQLVDALHVALGAHEYDLAASYNAVLSQEAFSRAYRVVRAWEARRDDTTGLFPFALSRWHNYWDSSAQAGNMYSHFYIASLYLDPIGVPSWAQTMRSERSICGALPCSIDLASGTVIQEELALRFGHVTEYGRDGLLSITERFGPGEWLDRLIEMTDEALRLAPVQTKRGPIPTNSTEFNGAQLQVLTRLYRITRNSRYLEMAERIADAYVFEVMPRLDGLTSDYWDFSAAMPLPLDSRFRPAAESVPGLFVLSLMDHGGELFAGLAELHLLERQLGRPQADAYRQPLMTLLDKLLAIGRNEDGLWVRTVDLNTLEPLNADIADTWGYNLLAYHIFDIAEGTERYAKDIAAMMQSVATQFSVDWEYGPQADGYADTIESMLYLLPWFDVPKAHAWVDSETEVMFLKQQDSGFVETFYLDGNFVRTALLYGQYKTQGIMPDVWSDTVRVGAALDRATDTLHVHVAAQEAWSGKLRFDTPRHSLILGMETNYPRVNSAPEWYVVEPDSFYTITDLDTGAVMTRAGQELAAGLEISLSGSESDIVRLAVRKHSSVLTR